MRTRYEGKQDLEQAAPLRSASLFRCPGRNVQVITAGADVQMPLSFWGSRTASLISKKEKNPEGVTWYCLTQVRSLIWNHVGTKFKITMAYCALRGHCKLAHLVMEVMDVWCLPCSSASH